jgi:hypothetical protein
VSHCGFCGAELSAAKALKSGFNAGKNDARLLRRHDVHDDAALEHLGHSLFNYYSRYGPFALRRLVLGALALTHGALELCGRNVSAATALQSSFGCYAA